MTPSAILAVTFGLILFMGYGIGQSAGWMHAKLALVLVLIVHHVYLGKLMTAFRHDRNRHGHVFYRWLNEIPAAPVLFGVVILVVVKPF
jgi:putative membrane protein